MREIKFRAWDREEKRIIDADAWTFGDEYQPFIDAVSQAQNEYDLMQYTGLKDKNGVEIYEGDIILTEHGEGCYKVYWNNFSASYLIEHIPTREVVNSIDQSDKEYIEVVGNIYENPELVKKQHARKENKR